MTGLMYRIGRSTAAHPWRTISAWVIAAVAITMLATASGGEPKDDYDVPASQAQQGFEQMQQHFPDGGGAGAQVVVHDPDGEALTPAKLQALSTELSTVPHVVFVSEPRMSQNADTALYQLQYDGPVTDKGIMGELAPLEDATERADLGDYKVEYGGEVPGSAAEIGGIGEMVGIGVALILLVLTFGSVIAAGLPILVALFGLAIASAGVTLLASFSSVSTTAPTIATMVGLGVGIDYALLLVTRYVEYLRAGQEPIEAAARANATAGRSVIFAGATVLVALMGLRLAGLPTYSSFGFATAIAVTAVMAASITLVPALSRLSGRRLMSRKERKQPASGASQTVGIAPKNADKVPFTARWATLVGKRPLAWALGSLIVLLTLAAPTLGMRMWPGDASSEPKEFTTRQAYDQVTESFGPGANGTFTFVADLNEVSPTELDQLTSEIADTPGIISVGQPIPSPDGAIALVDAEPQYGPQDARTSELIAHLRSDVLPDSVLLSGPTALYYDATEKLADRIWVVIAFVVLVSMILLAMMFRSIVIPIKAAVMNLLSIGAAYGVMVLIFQKGWGVELVGLDHSLPISSWIPILMFAVLFGLSMDYEVFLLSRIREEWLRTGDSHASVIHGLASTARVISAAAAIMVAVFLGFATEANVVVKMTGVGMAVAIAIDATIVRMILVPATMSMLGKWNWWLPEWLDRRLPHVDAEVEFIDELEPADATRSDASKSPATV